MQLPHDPTITSMGIYPEKILIQKDTCTIIFIAALFKIAKIWKQPKCSSTYEWMKMWYTHTHTHTEEYFSVIKSNEIMPFAAT